MRRITSLHAVEPGKAINTKLPKIDRENVKQEKAPIMFENLETKKIGSLKKCVLDEANQLLCRFRMGEVEELMGIFRNVRQQVNIFIMGKEVLVLHERR
ncbi:hypothetical protein FOPG_19486, partial [Fusarium oxysporum f. sp. conglutinans race 2 54008]